MYPGHITQASKVEGNRASLIYSATGRKQCAFNTPAAAAAVDFIRGPKTKWLAHSPKILNSKANKIPQLWYMEA